MTPADSEAPSGPVVTATVEAIPRRASARPDHRQDLLPAARLLEALLQHPFHQPLQAMLHPRALRPAFLQLEFPSRPYPDPLRPAARAAPLHPFRASQSGQR